MWIPNCNKRNNKKKLISILLWSDVEVFFSKFQQFIQQKFRLFEAFVNKIKTICCLQNSILSKIPWSSPFLRYCVPQATLLIVWALNKNKENKRCQDFEVPWESQLVCFSSWGRFHVTTLPFHNHKDQNIGVDNFILVPGFLYSVWAGFVHHLL